MVNLLVSDFVSDTEILLIKNSQVELEYPTTLKPYFDYLEEKISYDKIRLALAYLEKEKNKVS